jgi:hypothetical protein
MTLDQSIVCSNNPDTSNAKMNSVNQNEIEIKYLALRQTLKAIAKESYILHNRVRSHFFLHFVDAAPSTKIFF